jgi:predicted transcriptional regulator
MAEDKISQTTLKTLVEADAIRSASVVGEASGFYIAVKYGETEKILTARAGNIRFFRSMDTVVDFLRKTIGIGRFSVDMVNYDPEEMKDTGRKRPDRKEAMKKVNQAVERDKWFREQVEIGLKSADEGKARPANEFFNELESRTDDKPA